MIATAEAKSNSEGMADAMGRAADSAGKAADAMGAAANAAGEAAENTRKLDRVEVNGQRVDGPPSSKLGPSGSSSFSFVYQTPDLEAIAKRELELAAKIAENMGDTAQAQAIRDQIASENKKNELQALKDEAKYLQEQRQLWTSERNRLIKEQTVFNESLARNMPFMSVGDASDRTLALVNKVFGSEFQNVGGTSTRLLNEALQGFNPQIQQQQMKSQEQMGKSITEGNKSTGQKLDRINDTIGKAMSRPTEVNISGSEDIGGDVSKTLKALQIAQR